MVKEEIEPSIEERFRLAGETVNRVKGEIEALYRERREFGQRWNVQEQPDGGVFFTGEDHRAAQIVYAWLRDWRRRLADATERSNRALATWSGLKLEVERATN